jgi:thiol-disulfide isomerase/thioredoxin
MPDVAVQTLDGSPTRLSSEISGRVAVISLWATWCEACVAELDALSRLSERVEASGGVVLAVAVGELRATVRAFVSGRKMPWARLIDEDFKLADALGSKRVPTTLVLDRSGKIVFAGGALDEHALAALRNALDSKVAARQ